jgi:hypothetical protein
MRHFKSKMQRGLCLKHGCKNKRLPGSAICDMHKNQFELPLAPSVKHARAK